MLDSFPFLLAGSKLRPADTRERTFYPGTIPTADRGTFHLKRAYFNIYSSASFRRPFPCQLFLPPKPNGPQSIWPSTKFPHNHLQLSYLLWLTAQRKTSSQAVINYKIENYQCLHYFLSFNVRGNRTTTLTAIMLWIQYITSLLICKITYSKFTLRNSLWPKLNIVN